mgnify:CR=1 FL=1
MECEQIEFLAELAMVAALGFFDTVQVFLEILGIGKGRCVDAGKHTVLFVAAPVRPGNGQQLERLHEPGIRNVRPTAQVNEIAVPVQGDGPVFEALDQLDLVGSPISLNSLTASALEMSIRSNGTAASMMRCISASMASN